MFTFANSKFVKVIKTESTKFINENNLSEKKFKWQEGFGAFTYSISAKDKLIEYVKNQEEHHRIKTFRKEYVEILNEHEITFNEKYLP